MIQSIEISPDHWTTASNQMRATRYSDLQINDNASTINPWTLNKPGIIPSLLLQNKKRESGTLLFQNRITSKAWISQTGRQRLTESQQAVVGGQYFPARGIFQFWSREKKEKARELKRRKKWWFLAPKKVYLMEIKKYNLKEYIGNGFSWETREVAVWGQ